MRSIFGSLPKPSQFEQFRKSKHFDSQAKRFLNRNQPAIDQMRRELMSFSLALQWFKAGKNRRPKGLLPQVKPQMEEFLKPSQQLKIIWFGHSSLLLNYLGKIILIDPVFAKSASPFSFLVRRFQEPVLTREELPEIDYIVISHDHYDHLDMETVQFFKKRKAQFLAPLGVGSHLTFWGIEPDRITELDWWEKITLDGLDFIAAPAQHFSGRSLRYQNSTLWASWIIQGKGLNIFFSGDTGYDIHFKEIGDKYGPFDLVFIENGQYNVKWQAVHQLPEHSVQAYFDLKAKKYFPIHWGMFVLSMHSWREPVDRLMELAKARGVDVVTPQLGEIVSLSPDYQNRIWWSELQ